MNTDTDTGMNPKLAKLAIKTTIAANKPVFVWGSPGVGKSSIVKQIAEEQHRKLYDVRALLLESIDLRGLPTIKDGVTQWTRPAFLPPEDEKENSILFLDELNAAEQAVQASCYQLILDRRVGEYRLPDGCAIVAAGNKMSDRAHVNRMPSALANRLTHIDMKANADDWIEWALNNNIKTEIISYIMFRPDELFAFDPATDVRAFPTPRSWETVSRILDRTNFGSDKQTEEEKAVEFMLVKGTVGEGAGVGFKGFCDTAKDLPNVNQCLMDPTGARLPKTPEASYAICGALASRVGPATIDNFFTYVKRLEPEFTMLAIKSATQKNPDICESRSYIAWASTMTGH